MTQTIEQKFNKALKQGNKNAKAIDLDRFKKLCTTYDPTCSEDSVGIYADWLLSNAKQLECFRDGYIHGLADFHEFKKRLPSMGMSANIWDYKPADLPKIHRTINAVRNSKVSVSDGNSMEKLKGQYEIFQVNQDWAVVNTHTFDAERFFGSNTRWCTVGVEYYFKLYSDNGYYIAIPIYGGELDLKSRARLQFHIGDNCQLYCCDVNDYKVQMDAIPRTLKSFVLDKIKEKKQLVRSRIANMFVKLIEEIKEKTDLEPITSKRTTKITFQLKDDLKMVLSDTDLSLKLCHNGRYCTVCQNYEGRGYISHSNNTEAVNEQRIHDYIQKVMFIVTMFTDKSGCGEPLSYSMMRGNLQIDYKTPSGNNFFIKKSFDCNNVEICKKVTNEEAWRNYKLITNLSESMITNKEAMSLGERVDVYFKEEKAMLEVRDSVAKSLGLSYYKNSYYSSTCELSKSLRNNYGVKIKMLAHTESVIQFFLTYEMQSSESYLNYVTLNVPSFRLCQFSDNPKRIKEALASIVAAAEFVSMKPFNEIIKNHPLDWRTRVCEIMITQLLKHMKNNNTDLTLINAVEGIIINKKTI